MTAPATTTAAPASGRSKPLKVAVVAEFYPRAHDEVLGVWAHRQALAARDAGVEVEVIVLYRPIPSLSSLRRGPRAALTELRTLRAQPRAVKLDGLPVTYVPFYSAGRSKNYGTWGHNAARPLHRALTKLRKRFPYDLVHAHNAVPAADALRRRGGVGVPIITSVHGGDVFYTARVNQEWRSIVAGALDSSSLVLANSSGISHACRELTGTPVEVIFLGADVPEREPRPPREDTLITIAHLVARKRHADVLRAMWVLRKRWPKLQYVIVGDGPERATLEALAKQLEIDDRVEFTGQLPHEEALAAIDRSTLAVMPSIDEAYGVAYVEAMARGVPAIGSLGEPGPLDLADLGSGIQLAAPGDVEHLARVIDRLLADPDECSRLAKLGRETIAREASWEVCGRATVRAYERVLAGQAANAR